MRYIIIYVVYNKYLGEWENFNYLVYVYGVKVYVRLLWVFYDVGD